MTDLVRFLPLVALSLPLAGALYLAFWPERAAAERSRWAVQFVCLGLSLMAFVAAGFGRTTLMQMPYWGEPFALGRSLAVTVDQLSLWFGVLLLASLLAVSAVQFQAPAAGESVVANLFVAGAGIAVLVSANMTTLCLTWVLLDGGLLWIDARRARRSSTGYAIRTMLLRILSIIALVSATLLVQAEQGDVPIPLAALKGPASVLLMTAALLHLGIYPLPGGLERTWRGYLVSAIAGGYLWLRVAGLSAEALPGESWLVPVAGVVLAVSALLAATSGDEAPVPAYVTTHWLALLVLAPLLDVHAGVGLGCIVVANLALAVIPLLAAEGLEARSGGWWAFGRAVQLASVAGAPFTLGFLARWELLRITWDLGYAGLFFIAVGSFALASAPVWRQIAHFRTSREPAAADETTPPEGAMPPREPEAAAEGRVALWPSALFGTFLPALALVAAGSVPWLLQYRQSRLIGQVVLPLAEGPAAIAWRGGPLYAAVAALLSAAVGFLWSRHEAPGVSPSSVQTVLRTSLEMDWLYASAERTLAWAGSVLARGAAILERGSVSLGWILVWILAGLFFLTGG